MSADTVTHTSGRVYPKFERKSPSMVMFDADGVLIDAVDIHYQALNKAILRTAGGCLYYCIGLSEQAGRFNGLPTKVKLKILTEERGMPESMHEEIFRLKQQYTHEKFSEKLKPNPDVIQLLTTLRSMGIKVAMCSNATIESCIAMARSTCIYDLLEIILGNESVKKNKPAPDIYFKCAEIMGISIEDTVIVEDSPIGIEAAMAAHPGGVVRVRDQGEVNLNLLRKLLDIGR